MPLREINRIEREIKMHINFSFRKNYELKPGDVLICEVKRHFRQEKVVNRIDEKVEIKLQDTMWIEFPRDLPALPEKYGIQEADYLEVVYTQIKRDGETIEVYPGETKEFLDFIPEEE